VVSVGIGVADGPPGVCVRSGVLVLVEVGVVLGVNVGLLVGVFVGVLVAVRDGVLLDTGVADGPPGV
jgi:hypothetical protein